MQSPTSNSASTSRFLKPCVVSLAFLLLSGLSRQSSAGIDPGDVAGVWLFDEGSGNIARDFSGNGNDGVLVDSPGFSNDDLPTWETGQFGTAVAFDGVDDFMQASTAGFPIENEERTIALWVKTPTPTQRNRMLCGWGLAADNSNNRQASGLVLGLNQLPNQKPAFWARQPDLVCTAANGPPDGCTQLDADTWYHIAVTVETDGVENTVTLYIDGQVEVSDVFANLLETPEGTHFYVGDFRWVMDSFEGTFDEVAVFTAALAQEDIQSLMGGIETVLPPPIEDPRIDPASIVAAYQFEEATGDALDSSGNDNHGVLLGGETPPVREAGKFGMGLSFDGLDDDMQATSTGFPTGTEERTMALWVKTPNTQVGNKLLAGWGDPGQDQQVSSLVLGLNNMTSQKAAFWGRGDRMDLECTVPPRPSCTLLAPDTWHHIAVTTRGKMLTLYLDGVLEAKTPALEDLQTPAGTTFHVGKFPQIMGPFEGVFDEVVVLDVALNPSQVGRLLDGLDSALLPIGACAQAGGLCDLLTAAECTNQGGTYSGDGTSCPSGACQLNDGCQTLTASQCSALGGTYAGDGEACTVGALNLPGDCNQDGTLDLSDVICLLGHLFQGNPATLPCSTTPANLALMDCNQDGGTDLSDAIYKLAFLFQGGAGPLQGQTCIAIADCPSNSGCP